MVVKDDEKKPGGFFCAGKECLEKSRERGFDPSGEDGKNMKTWELKGPQEKKE